MRERVKKGRLDGSSNTIFTLRVITADAAGSECRTLVHHGDSRSGSGMTARKGTYIEHSLINFNRLINMPIIHIKIGSNHSSESYGKIFSDIFTA